MDPYATLARWSESDFGSDDREEAYQALVGWLERGGFAPDQDSQAWASFLATWCDRSQVPA